MFGNVSSRRVGRVALVVGVVFLVVLTLRFVVAQMPPSVTPTLMSSYGIATVYGSGTLNGGSTNIQIFSNVSGPIFVEKLLVVLPTPLQSDIILDRLSVGSVYAYSFSSYGAPRVVVVPTGETIGDAVSSLPTTLSILIVKDPIGNSAVFASGGATNGLTFSIRLSTPLVGGEVNVLALVAAPATATVTLSIS